MGKKVIHPQDLKLQISLHRAGLPEGLNLTFEPMWIKTFEGNVTKLGDKFSESLVPCCDWEFKCSPVGKCLERWFILVSRAIMAFWAMTLNCPASTQMRPFSSFCWHTIFFGRKHFMIAMNIEHYGGWWWKFWTFSSSGALHLTYLIEKREWCWWRPNSGESRVSLSVPYLWGLIFSTPYYPPPHPDEVQAHTRPPGGIILGGSTNNN